MQILNDLAKRNCKPCNSGEGSLDPTMAKTLMNQLPGEWQMRDNHRLEKTFKFPDFKSALAFTNHIGSVAEEQGHHPNIFLTYDEVKVQLSTHAAQGLTENDFILAAKINHVV